MASMPAFSMLCILHLPLFLPSLLSALIYMAIPSRMHTMIIVKRATLHSSLSCCWHYRLPACCVRYLFNHQASTRAAYALDGTEGGRVSGRKGGTATRPAACSPQRPCVPF